MRRHSFRHLPVCPEGHLVGMVSLRHILLHDLNEQEDEVRMMRACIHSMRRIVVLRAPATWFPLFWCRGI